jgi:hypothetical protein
MATLSTASVRERKRRETPVSDSGFVQISDSRRNAFEGEVDPGLALVEREDVREVSWSVNFPERLKSQFNESAATDSGRRAHFGGRGYN